MEKGFNYFSYALVKGQHQIAFEMLGILREKGLATDDVINEKIQTHVTNSSLSIFDMCIIKKYKNGLNFLLNHTSIQVSPKQREDALKIIEEGSSIRSVYDNQASMAENTSRGSDGTHSLNIAGGGTDAKRRRNISGAFQTNVSSHRSTSYMVAGQLTPSKHHQTSIKKQLP